jgi:hypothetical protein
MMMLKSLLLACALSTAQLCTAQSANYVRYDNYTVANYSSVVDQVVPTVTDCLAVSNAAPLANGVAYNDLSKLCRLLTANNNDILITLKGSPGWVTYVKDIATQTRMVYKAQALQSSSQQAYGAFVNTGGSFTSQYTAAVASLNTTQSCNCTYRNGFIDRWNVTQVSYPLLVFRHFSHLLLNLKLGYILSYVSLLSACFDVS